MAEFIFWLIIGANLYTYLGYPAFTLFLSLFVNNPVNKGNEEPNVTFLITAYNEEKFIKEKLENTLALNYPRERLEIIVASDGSTDRTDAIVKTFEKRGVILCRVEGRVGKTETQNQAIKMATGDIVIFSDAPTTYGNDAIRMIVRNYHDLSVGAVSGRYEYVNPTGTPVGLGTILFWKYENFLKSRQTKIKTVTGCCGCIYSVRRELYENLPKDIISDLVEPLKILEKGYRIAFEPEAVAYETTTESSKQEFSMRIRVISRGMYGLWYMRKLFNPFKFGFVSFQLLSHKVMRWMIPFGLPLLLASNIALVGRPIYDLILIGQVLFYLAAGGGYLLERKGRKGKVFALPLYYCLVNAASIIAFFRTLMGRKSIVWETGRG